VCVEGDAAAPLPTSAFTRARLDDVGGVASSVASGERFLNSDLPGERLAAACVPGLAMTVDWRSGGTSQHVLKIAQFRASAQTLNISLFT